MPPLEIELHPCGAYTPRREPLIYTEHIMRYYRQPEP